ncbi:MAG: protein kinase [Archangiaceae bacterium]|nr:protein kinase [Archangiaceae bacterium]
MKPDRATPEPLEATSASKSTFLRPGTEVLHGRFRVLELLGKGGMGEVYLAEQVSLGRKVALKTLREDLSLQPGMTERFKREALLLSSVDHPSVVRVIDFGEANSSYVLVMEFVEGENLALALRGGPFEAARAVRVLKDIAEGLAEIHAKGIVHRDLKLDNVLLAPIAGGERARLLDFGIARLAEAEGPGQQVTQAGMVLGTPEYIAPEQATGQKLDARTDVYAFGILAYRLLTGAHPFPGPSAREFLMQHISMEPPALVVPGLPRLEALVMACLAKKPDGRPASGAALLAALGKIDASQATTDPALSGVRGAVTASQRTPVTLAPTQASTLIGRNLALVCVCLERFAERQSPELVQVREQKVLGVLRAGGGKVVRAWQDQVLAVFELPSQAVGCGMAILDALWRSNASAHEKLEASVMVHQGEVVQSGESLLGEPAQVLAELVKGASRGEVTLTRAVWLAMAKGAVLADEQGSVEVAGRPEPFALMRCRQTGPGAPFGGRDVALAESAGLLGRLLR